MATATLSESPTVVRTAAHAAELDFSALLAAATRAPSGDNLQPWFFIAHPQESRIDVYCDTRRDASVLNAGQRMALISCGAAIENIVLLARENGFDCRLNLETGIHVSSPRKRLARLTFSPRATAGTEGNVMAQIAARVTNRRRYDGRVLDSSVEEALRRATPPLSGAKSHWLTGRDHIVPLAAAIGCGDAVLFGEAAFRNAFLKNVRFDLPADTAVEEGLSLSSLELSGIDRLALQTLRRLPDALIRLSPAALMFAAHARSLVQSATGLCVITSDDSSSCSEICVGRAMQRAWLALTRQGLSAQPMMSLCVLDNALRCGDLAAFARGPEAAWRVVTSAHDVFTARGLHERVRFILRFGYAPAPSGRTGRMTVATCGQTR